MTARMSLYRDIHKGIRSLMFDLIRKSGRVDFTDAAAVAHFRADVKAAFTLLSLHAHHENTFIGPLVAQHAPELRHMVGPTHDDQEVEIHELLSRLDAVDHRAADVATKGHALVVRLSGFFGDLLMHMAEEEEQIMPALWAAMTDDELLAVEQRLVGSVAPDKLAQFLSWMLPAMNTPERVAMIAGMEATAPPQVFAFVRELARGVLSPADDAALDRVLDGRRAVLAG